jgi:hypothetical protein
MHQGFQRSINKTCCSSKDKFITDRYNGESITIYTKALFTSKQVCLHVGEEVRKENRNKLIGIG